MDGTTCSVQCAVYGVQYTSHITHLWSFKASRGEEFTIIIDFSYEWIQLKCWTFHIVQSKMRIGPQIETLFSWNSRLNWLKTFQSTAFLLIHAHLEKRNSFVMNLNSFNSQLSSGRCFFNMKKDVFFLHLQFSVFLFGYRKSKDTAFNNKKLVCLCKSSHAFRDSDHQKDAKKTPSAPFESDHFGRSQ